MKEEKLNRLTTALALSEEFGVADSTELHENGRITVLVHEHWLKELEHRLAQIHWRFIHESGGPGPFRALALVDSFR